MVHFGNEHDERRIETSHEFSILIEILKTLKNPMRCPHHFHIMILSQTQFGHWFSWPDGISGLPDPARLLSQVRQAQPERLTALQNTTPTMMNIMIIG